MPHTDPPAAPLAELTHASVSRGDTELLTPVSLRIAPGELLTIVGPSGAGKSTVLALLAGLLQPTSGTLRRPEDGGGSTRLVFQEPRLLPWRTVEENVRLGLEFRANGGHGLGHAHDADARVAALLRELRVADLADRMPDELSGGQAQRVSIARAVAASPTLLLLDEPFSALDPVTRADTQRWLREVHQRLGLTTVLVTHDLAEAAALGDRVAVLTRGNDIELLERAHHADAPELAQQRLESELQARLAEALRAEPLPERPVRRARSRREFITAAAAGALIALPIAASAFVRPGASSAAASEPSANGAGATAERATLRIGYLPITDAAPLLIAHDSGEFSSRQIDTPAPTLFRSWASLVEALQGGSIDVAHLLMPLAMQLRYDAGVPIKVLAWNHVNGSALAVQHSVNAVGDLAGTSVAVPGWFSIHNVVLQQMLREAGLTAVINTPPSVEAGTVQLIVLPPADMPTALGNGSIAGYIVAEPFCAVAEVQGTGKILRFTGDVWREHACCVTVVREDLVTEQPELAQRVADAVVAAQASIRADRAWAADRLSTGGYLPQPPAAIAKVLDEHPADHARYHDAGAVVHADWNEPRIGFQPYAYPSYTERLVEELRLTTVDADTAWLADLNSARVHDDLVSVAINQRAVDAAGGLAAFDATATRKELIRP